MKRIAFQLLLSLALIFQGVSAFAAISANAACCDCDGQIAQTHCQHGHGAPCTSNCALHCIGCTPSVFVAMPGFSLIPPLASVAVSLGVRAQRYTCDDLPPTRPPIA